MRRFVVLSLLIVTVVLAIAPGTGRQARATQGANFDTLSAEDRKTFQDRFKSEIWPLLSRNGKDGCVGCHAGKIVSALRMSGDAGKDFAMLLKEGFFLVDDRGSLLSRIVIREGKRRMPPGERERWSEAEVNKLRGFMVEMERKQRN